ncbi:UDP-N-acetylmuramoyl-L-alanyl-D-glutamate--2,6-diaminopimelate ligase [Patescibacteria group bacterium]|nr:UDP-N-acetylmuramoyl-L-alanyl-D-glutamate--2,6-diaminopimelate ligase [Patescibacteria group bacterium]MBU0776960.1 UDP-N-acetylmuramoyl-L-alanyl-D-glutamate--2,6-diaminopimelate ligase [Patescibacteria group bacterium]MBU0845678.1 UDP-N-acetylmuramoyl-L-alanyl-D-glutamate--2,6-diaminopimelate ligase [Patescibacteria group bacterium]MBU0922989.1 UDP-N-acetylmuramoyl-L-alanyl-D-glutamate--2,6-diaminopimelate ligase [Patescibacteria group bacterium]MBU1066922.1 UDP-N-acetylmuramoyl-L-alanyl-D-
MIPFIKNKLHFLKAVLAIIYFRYPARKLKVIGVTGTDGKTTTSTLIYYLLLAAKKKVALVSTVAAYVGEKEIDTGLHVTTPDSWHLQKLIKKIADEGYKYLVLEATSHGLDQHRLLGTNVFIAVLTNITHEHLDYHKTYAKYLNTKAKMFRNVDVAILNKSDSSYIHIKKILNSGTKVVSYSEKTLKKDLGKAIRNKFAENYNRLNATASILAAKELNIDNERIIKGIKDFSGIPGRMEEIKNKKGIKIYIDFAHTPNALENVLETLNRKKGNSKLIVVFGCAGERDIEKRYLMGKIAARLADISIITAEDPRNENINDIIEQIINGTDDISKQKRSKIIKEPERGKAILLSIEKTARRGDTVVICGKGHEKSMAYNGKEYPWSDREAVLFALMGKARKLTDNLD